MFLIDVTFGPLLLQMPEPFFGLIGHQAILLCCVPVAFNLFLKCPSCSFCWLSWCLSSQPLPVIGTSMLIMGALQFTYCQINKDSIKMSYLSGFTLMATIRFDNLSHWMPFMRWYVFALHQNHDTCVPSDSWGLYCTSHDERQTFPTFSLSSSHHKLRSGKHSQFQMLLHLCGSTLATTSVNLVILFLHFWMQWNIKYHAVFDEIVLQMIMCL